MGRSAEPSALIPYLDLGEYRWNGVDFFGLGEEGRQCRLVLDQRTSIDDQAVNALRALGHSAGICRHRIVASLRYATSGSVERDV